jgi:hypothetical protein
MWLMAWQAYDIQTDGLEVYNVVDNAASVRHPSLYDV